MGVAAIVCVIAIAMTAVKVTSIRSIMAYATVMPQAAIMPQATIMSQAAIMPQARIVSKSTIMPDTSMVSVASKTAVASMTVAPLRPFRNANAGRPKKHSDPDRHRSCPVAKHDKLLSENWFDSLASFKYALA